MKRLRVITVGSALGTLLLSGSPILAQAPTLGSNALPTPKVAVSQTREAAVPPASAESTANTLAVPRQILRTGVVLNDARLSANSEQLADLIKLTPVLHRVEQLRTQVNAEQMPTSETLPQHVALLEAEQKAHQLIQKTELAVEYVSAEIYAEHELYSELLATLQSKAAKRVQYSNWASYWSNGALWAIAEALDIPTWKRPKYAISSGTTGIIAGVIPSIFSLYAMHVSNGSKYPGEADANMLAQVLNAPTTTEVEYPNIIWDWLKAPPAAGGKSRKDQLIDRWIADSNLPSFTDRSSHSQIDAIAAVTDRKKAVGISLLQTRVAMLTQLHAEIGKMKRLLYELALAVDGDKQL